MARSDAILERLLRLHPKIIDLTLDRMERILAALDHPERKLPPVIHVAGTNGKGSCVAYLRAIIEAAGLTAHCYTSPHLVKFHERIRVAGAVITEDALSALLDECEAVNGGEPITFFEITTAAAFLAFARTPADYLILEVGLGGRLDATNVIDKPAATCITSIGLDHQQYLGDTIELIAAEKAGILKRGVMGVIGRMPWEARQSIENVAETVGAPVTICDQDWQAYTQHGRMVFQDADGLLDLPLPNLVGAHQIENAGNAIATIRILRDFRISDDAVETGATSAVWPARLQRLKIGALSSTLSADSELWLDGGHNEDAGRILASAMIDLQRRNPKPLVLVWGMLNTKDASAFLKPLAGIATAAFTLAIPGEANALSAETLRLACEKLGLQARACDSLEHALKLALTEISPARILICGSLYLAGHVLAVETGEDMSAVTGAARR
jgi:dihydrofolate synthase / folylpolyglutamate synthase